MSLSIYVHIPYCLQLCPYCDFAKYKVGTIPDQEQYTQLLIKEIRQKAPLLSRNSISSIYFGGGTPSLMTPKQLGAVLKELWSFFPAEPQCEVTIEINPGTISQSSLEDFLNIGVNRFSVGAQTFDDDMLKKIGRKHSANETRQTLSLLDKNRINYTLDILFALPDQTLDLLKRDLDIALQFDPPHVSTYYLNVPDYHSLARDRAPEPTQVDMFYLLEETLENCNILRYEISNYAKPGRESQHNIVYWSRKPYWGIGLGAHSYLQHESVAWGCRFFNPRTYGEYEKSLQKTSEKHLWNSLKKENYEILEKHQAMTEFCYTSLRRTRHGFSLNEFVSVFGFVPRLLEQELKTLMNRGLLSFDNDRYTLSKQGCILSNLVFERLTFLKEDLY